MLSKHHQLAFAELASYIVVKWSLLIFKLRLSFEVKSMN